MTNWNGERLAALAPAVDEIAARTLFDRRRARRRVWRRAAATTCVLVVLTSVGVGLTLADRDRDESVDVGGRGLVEGADFVVLDVKTARREEMGGLRAATNGASFDDLWTDAGLDGTRPSVDFARWVVVTITIPDDACPPGLVAFARHDAVLTPSFVEQTDRCQDPLIPKTFIVAFTRSSVAPSFTLRLPANDTFGLDEQRLTVDVPTSTTPTAEPDDVTPIDDGWHWQPLASPIVRLDGGSYFATQIFAVGDDALVFHGSTGATRVAAEILDLDTDEARTIAQPSLDWGHYAAAWTGSELLVWNGRDGARYDPAADSWRPIADAPVADGAGTAVWTGIEMIVFPVGLAYDPAADSWRRLAKSPLRPREMEAHAWTGSQYLVWGGCDTATNRCMDPTPGDELADGAVYDVATDTWRAMSPAPIAGRDYFAGAWTGTEMIVWGGSTDPDSPFSADGAAYDPARDSWRTLPPAPIPNRTEFSATWTGTDVIIWGGSLSDAYSDGARFDPVANAWRRIADSNAGPRRAHAAAWVDDHLVVAGGYPNAYTWSYAPR